MGFYEKHLLPKILNLVMKTPDLTRLRAELIPLAKGRVGSRYRLRAQPAFL